MIIIRTPFTDRIERGIIISAVSLALIANTWLVTEWWDMKSKLNQRIQEDKAYYEKLKLRIPEKLRGRLTNAERY